MLRGLYTAASGMLAQMVQTDTLANNLANMGTAGFKTNAVQFQAFPEMLLKRVTSDGAQDVGSVMNGSKVYATATQFNQGQLQVSGNPLDFAISGDGFFTVKHPVSGETFYTRNGEFMVNKEGFLSTREGMLVQGRNGNIQIPANASAIQVNEQGLININNIPADRLVITRFNNNNDLSKAGNSLFKAGPNAEELPTVAGSTRRQAPVVKQGTIELSNTNVVGELVNTITGLRVYEALEKNIRIHNETLQRAINDVGRVR